MRLEVHAATVSGSPTVVACSTLTGSEEKGVRVSSSAACSGTQRHSSRSSAKS